MFSQSGSYLFSTVHAVEPMTELEEVWPPTALSYSTVILSVILMVLIILGNGLVCLAIIIDPFKKLKNQFNYFLINLACSDLIVGFVMMPLSIYIHLQEVESRLTPSNLKVFHLTFFISSTASLLSLAALWYDRNSVISNTQLYRKMFNKKKCLLICTFILVISLSVPWLYLQMGIIQSLMVFANVGIVTIFIIMVALYIKTNRMLKQHRLRVEQYYNDIAILQHLKLQQKITNTFQTILMAFLLTYIPSVIMINCLYFCTDCNIILREIFRDLQFLIIVSKSATNPYVCALNLKAYKKAVIHLILSTKLYFIRRFEAEKVVYSYNAKLIAYRRRQSSRRMSK